MRALKEIFKDIVVKGDQTIQARRQDRRHNQNQSVGNPLLMNPQNLSNGLNARNQQIHFD